MDESGTAVQCLESAGFLSAKQSLNAFLHRRFNVTAIKAAAPRAARLTADPRAGIPDDH
jgi:hypothetical protein